MTRQSLHLIAISLLVWLACQARQGMAERSHYGRMVVEVFHQIEQHYLEPVDPESLLDGALTGTMNRLDEYSAYLDRDSFRDIQQDLDQQFGGIGVQVTIDPKTERLTIISPIVGTPAFAAGLRAGDQIVTVDGKSIRGLKLDDARRLLQGQPGTQVRLGVLRIPQGDAAADDQPAKPIEVEISRAIIETESVVGDLRDSELHWDFFLRGQDRIGYVRISPMFSDKTVAELREALAWLRERQARAVILDLRSNPGGLLPAAIGVCRLLVAEGRIVSTRGRSGELMQEFDADGSAEFADIPLAVLVNRLSASASEIVAACLQDHCRAVIVGERTWGKGSVQDVIQLEGGDRALKLTTASYWRPSGRNIHRTRTAGPDDPWGVEPDSGCELKLEDTQLREYLDWRNQRDVVRRAGEEGSPDPTQPETAESPLIFDVQLAKAVEVVSAKLASPVSADAGPSAP